MQFTQTFTIEESFTTIHWYRLPKRSREFPRKRSNPPIVPCSGKLHAITPKYAVRTRAQSKTIPPIAERRSCANVTRFQVVDATTNWPILTRTRTATVIARIVSCLSQMSSRNIFTSSLRLRSRFEIWKVWQCVLIAAVPVACDFYFWIFCQKCNWPINIINFLIRLCKSSRAQSRRDIYSISILTFSK